MLLPDGFWLTGRAAGIIVALQGRDRIYGYIQRTGLVGSQVRAGQRTIALVGSSGVRVGRSISNSPPGSGIPYRII